MPLPLIAGAAIQAIPALLGMAGNMMDKKRRAREEGKASKGFSQLTDIFKGNLDQDYFDTAEAQGAMKEIDQNSQENMNQINATANMNGMTDEAKIAMMGKNMSAKQNAYSGLAGNASLWRQRAMQNYQGSLGSLFSVGQYNRGNQQNSMNNIVGGAQGAIDGAANMGLFDNMGMGGKATNSQAGVGAAAGFANAFKMSQKG